MKQIFFTLFISALVIAGLSSCSEEPDINLYSTLHGIVTDDASGEAIPAATVTLSPSGKTQTTGTDGRYQFSEIEALQYTVTVQKPGYATNRKMVTVESGVYTEANVSLHSLAAE